jgi:hypothetical protein
MIRVNVCSSPRSYVQHTGTVPFVYKQMIYLAKIILIRMLPSVFMYIGMVEFGATIYHISHSCEVYQPQSIFISLVVDCKGTSCFTKDVFFSYLTVEVTYDDFNIVRCALVIASLSTSSASSVGEWQHITLMLKNLSLRRMQHRLSFMAFQAITLFLRRGPTTKPHPNLLVLSWQL